MNIKIVLIILTILFTIVLIDIKLDVNKIENKSGKHINDIHSKVHILIDNKIRKDVSLAETKEEKLNVCLKNLETFDLETTQNYRYCIKLIN